MKIYEVISAEPQRGLMNRLLNKARHAATDRVDRKRVLKIAPQNAIALSPSQAAVKPQQQTQTSTQLSTQQAAPQTQETNASTAQVVTAQPKLVLVPLPARRKLFGEKK